MVKIKDITAFSEDKELLDYFNLDDAYIFKSYQSSSSEAYNYIDYINTHVRDIKKAIMKYIESGWYVMQVVERKYGENMFHNLEGHPSIWFKNSAKCELYLDRRSIQHRALFPAVIRYSEEGNVIDEQYYIKGKSHNRVGPAKRFLYGRRWINTFYINGKEITLDDFCKQMERNF